MILQPTSLLLAKALHALCRSHDCGIDLIDLQLVGEVDVVAKISRVGALAPRLAGL